MSLNEIISIIICIAVVLLVIKFIKGVLKFIISVAVVLAVGIYIFMPSKLTDVSDFIKSESFNKVQEIVNKSENVKIDKDDKNETVISVKIGDAWFDTREIDDVVRISDDSCVLKINGKNYTVTDKQVIQVIKLMK